MAYLPLSTANLPDPAINPAQGSTPDQYFDVGIWTGDGVNGRNIADLYGHTPDWVWIKNRSAAIDHNVADVLRGWKELYPNLTNAEGSQQMNAPTNDGLSGLPASNGYNNNGNSYVSWAWKANGSGVSNTDGSITSTVSANTKSGLSIVTYVGNNTRGATIGHGLNNVPEFVMVKNRDDGAENWACFHKDLAGTFPSIKLNTNDATVTSADGVVIRGSEFTSSVISVGENATCNGNGNDMVAYCFHSVEGFSKFSSFVGNGSTDGPFVYTGFRPAFVMVKASSTGGEHWNIIDDKRDNFNDGNNNLLYASLSNSEGSSTPHYLDFLSNGIKLSGNVGNWNTSGVTYIYMAFAENPFKYSNAR